MPHADLAASLTAELKGVLRAADAELVARFPGDAPGRQPVHTVYVPADVYDADLVPRWGEEARSVLASHEPLLAGLVGRAAGEVLPLVAGG